MILDLPFSLCHRNILCSNDRSKLNFEKIHIELMCNMLLVLDKAK